MRLCANENISGDCVSKLRQMGHDVLWIRESAPGSPDLAVLARAYEETRVLITFDKDFGQLVFQFGAKASHGVILFRISQSSSAIVAERAAAILASREDWTGYFSVVDDFGIRMRPLHKNPQSRNGRERRDPVVAERRSSFAIQGLSGQSFFMHWQSGELPVMLNAQ